MSERIIEFPKANLYRLAAEVKKLNKVAAKLSVPPVSFEVLDEFAVAKRSDIWDVMELGYGFDVDVEYVRVRIEGDSPKLPGGWYFVGAVEHLEAGNLLHGDDEVMASYREAPADCSHCGFKRNRRKTVVLRDEAGNVTQVGSSCLKDFLGYHGDPERVLRFIESVSDLADEMEEERGWFRGPEGGCPTDIFLTVVAAVVRTHGWTAKSAVTFGGHSTAEITGAIVDNLRVNDVLKKLVEAVRLEDRDVVEAKAVAEWARTIPATTSDNYLGNVRVALLGSYVLPRHYGIAASAVSARRKEEERREAKEEADRIVAASEWVGTIGKREEFELTVRFVSSFPTDYGMKYIVSMVDDSGNILKAFSVGSFGSQAEKGDRYVVRGTVKEHGEWQGRKETTLSRVTVIEDLTILD